MNEIDGKIGSVTLVSTETGEEKEFKTDGVFVYTGMDPLVKPVEKLGIERNGLYRNQRKYGNEKLPGIFAAGDVRG